MRPQALASLGAPAAGRVASVQVRPGERIVAGAVLASIQSSDAAATRAALEGHPAPGPLNEKLDKEHAWDEAIEGYLHCSE